MGARLIFAGRAIGSVKEARVKGPHPALLNTERYSSIPADPETKEEKKGEKRESSKAGQRLFVKHAERLDGAASPSSPDHALKQELAALSPLTSRLSGLMQELVFHLGPFSPGPNIFIGTLHRVPSLLTPC